MFNRTFKLVQLERHASSEKTALLENANTDKDVKTALARVSTKDELDSHLRTAVSSFLMFSFILLNIVCMHVTVVEVVRRKPVSRRQSKHKRR